MRLRRLTPKDAASYKALRVRGLKECPTVFGSSYAEEVRKPVSAYADRLILTADRWMFGVFDGEALVATATLVREAHAKERHKANIYGMYVGPRHRRLGLGRQLIERCLRTARAMRRVSKVRIVVVETNTAAIGLYQSLGFKVYAREKDALRVAGVSYPELFMDLTLRR